MHFPGDNDALRGRRVLVIEDEMLVAMEFESVLQRMGASWSDRQRASSRPRCCSTSSVPMWL
jgi:hypothetical protein